MAVVLIINGKIWQKLRVDKKQNVMTVNLTFDLSETSVLKEEE